jgi:putative transposase
MWRSCSPHYCQALTSPASDAEVKEVKGWQSRPLDPVYPIVYIDAFVVKVRDWAYVVNKAAHLVVGVDTDARSTCWAFGCNPLRVPSSGSALTQLRNRGVHDVLIACCDGLDDLPEAIETVWPWGP